MDVARLGLAVDSSQVEKGTVSLHQLTGAAGQASAAARQLAGASQAEAAGQKVAASATQAHTAALAAQNAVIRSSMHQRTMMIYQLNDVAVSLASGMNPAMVAMQQGSQILQGGFVPAVRTLSDLVGGLVSKLWPLGAAIGAASALLHGFTRQINEASNANVSMADVAIAAWESMASAVQSVLAPAFAAVTDFLNREIDTFTEGFVRETNFLIGLSVGTVDALKEVWGVLPDAIGYVMFEMARSVSNTIVKMQSDILASMNDLFSRIDTMAMSLGGEAFLPRFDIHGFQSSNYKNGANPYGSASDAIGAAGNAFNSAMGRDYVGGWLGGVGARAQDIAAARQEMDALGGSTKAANDNAKALNDTSKSLADTWGGTLKSAWSGFWSEFKSGLQEGKGFWESLGNAGANALDKIADRALSMAANGIFDMIFGSLFGGLGGGNSLGGGWGVAGGFGGRGIFGIPGMAEGGTVGRAGLSWVGEQGPELLRLPQGAQVIPNGPSMAMAANQNSGGDIVINNVINVPAGTSPETAPAIAREVTKELRKQLPDAIQSYNRNPLRRVG